MLMLNKMKTQENSTPFICLHNYPCYHKIFDYVFGISLCNIGLPFYS